MIGYLFSVYLVLSCKLCALIGAVSSMLVVGCAISPADRIDQQADKYGFIRQEIQGAGFSHVIYHNNPAIRAGVLHVYLEGDGLPWIHDRHGLYISSDPTPLDPLMLRLMALDTAPSIYLGRPCYYGLANRPPCNPQYWTYGRYSPPVLASMAAVLRKFLVSGQYSGLVFFGHSGGGTLAMLLADRFAQTFDVITLAGNLDPEAWTTYHNYSALHTSLNPSHREPLDPAIYQLHLVGARDRKIPPKLLHAAVARQKGAEIWVIPDFDHHCCWQALWPSVLKSVSCR
jgi:pimeloyl-ACP methyl ester carboxylesterase